MVHFKMESVVLRELHLNLYLHKTTLEENLQDKGWTLSFVQSTVFRFLNRPGSLPHHGLCITLVPAWNADQWTAVSTPSKLGSSSLPISSPS